jgi:signal transduction histidine kinase
MGTVGDVIERHRAEILHLWEEGACHGAWAVRIGPPELAGVMPAYLDSLGRSRHDDDQPLPSASQQELIEHHLSNRLRYGLELNEIVTEFAILGRCVCRVVDDQPAEHRPAPGEVAGLFSELYAAVMAVTRIFNEHMLEDQQREKRYDRLLQRIASETMSAPDHARVPVRKLLSEALTVVMAAMGAQSAALLLFDAKTKRLIISASNGIAAEHLEEYVGVLDESAFTGRVSSSDDGTTFVRDAETAQLGVSETLRRSGIRSLLGVRLATGRMLHGVLHIGMCEQRSFSSGEVRRLEDLGLSLTMYLENARLHAALSDEKDGIAREGELRERFVSVLMHDLMGPLEAAKANAGRLREPWTIDDPQEVAAKVYRDLERTEWIVRGLLDVHRIRAGHRLRLRLEEFDLGAIARDAVEELRASHGNRIVLHADRSIRGMWSAEQLRRAIWNLALNGIEHGAAGRPITISVVGDPAGAEVKVHNEGPEIAPEQQAELFHPFSLPGSAIRGPRFGWGLGLTFVWGCAEAHGGNVAVESKPGQGTTFRLQLPYDARPYVE